MFYFLFFMYPHGSVGLELYGVQENAHFRRGDVRVRFMQEIRTSQSNHMQLFPLDFEKTYARKPKRGFDDTSNNTLATLVTCWQRQLTQSVILSCNSKHY